MATTPQCPKCDSGREWNLRPLHFVVAVALLVMGGDRLFDFVTEGWKWQAGLTGFALVVGGIGIGLMAAQHPLWYCRSCKSRF